MKHMLRSCGAIALLVFLPLSAMAAEDLSPSDTLWRQIDAYGQKHYRGGATLERAFLAGNADLGSSDSDVSYLQDIYDSLNPSVDIVLFGVADTNRVVIMDRFGRQFVMTDRHRKSVNVTQLPTTDNMHQILNGSLALRRAQRANDAVGDVCVVANMPIISSRSTDRGYAVGIFKRQPGVPTLMTSRPSATGVTREELADSMAALRDHDRLQDTRLDWQQNELRNTLKKCDLGLDVGFGASWITVNGDQYNGPTVSFDLRYLDLVLQGFGGQSFNQTTATEWYDGISIPVMSDNHFEGGSVFWAPLQRGCWGRFFRIGVTGLHAQRINAFNDSKQQAYMGGLTASLSLGIRYATPEVYGTIGYGRTIRSPETNDNTPIIDEGVATMLGVRFTIGPR